MLNTLIAAVFLLVGFVNALPVIGVLGADTLTRLYQAPIANDVLALMRHRATMLGLLGSFAMVAAFKIEWQLIAGILILLSMLAFIALVALDPHANAAIRKIMWIDIVLSALLLPCLIWRVAH